MLNIPEIVLPFSLVRTVLQTEDLMQEFIDTSAVRLNKFHPGSAMSQDYVK